MAQQRSPEDRPDVVGSGPSAADRQRTARGAAAHIEKGWTVYDAVDRPLGNITDVDAARGMLLVDGRPAGFGSFEVPLNLVASTVENGARLTKVLDARFSPDGGAPRLLDAPAETTAATPSPSSRARSRTRTSPTDETSAPRSTTPNTPTSIRDAAPSEPAPIRASASPRTGSTPSAAPATGPTARGTTTTAFGSHGTSSQAPSSRATASGAYGAESFQTFSPPYATTPTYGGTPTTDWGDDDGSSGWSGKKLALAALALGGAAAASYVVRRRMRRPTMSERLLMTASSLFDDLSELTADYASDAFEVTADFLKDRNPAWWASLAAAALPVAYYAWPSSPPTVRQQARSQMDDLSSSLESYLGPLAAWLPMMSGSSQSFTERVQRNMPSSWPSSWPTSWPTSWKSSSDWSVPSDWSSRSDLMWPVGMVAAGALALYLARRTTRMRSSHKRIADVMTRQPRVIQPDATVADAATMMRRLDVGALPVCDGSRLIGMLTDRDITLRSTADGRDPHLTTVRDVMSPGVAWATEDDPVEEAARIMREHQIRRLPIVDERHSLVGVVSLGDLAVDANDDELSGDTLERISEPGSQGRAVD